VPYNTWKATVSLWTHPRFGTPPSTSVSLIWTSADTTFFKPFLCCILSRVLTRMHLMTPTKQTLSGRDTSLPPLLASIIPQCAQPCILGIVQKGYVPSICSGTTNVSCLCGHYSNSGYTLGEMSLACLTSACEDTDSSDALKTYQICNNQTGAVTPTHSVLTLLSSATPSSSSTISVPSAIYTSITKSTSSSPTPVTSSVSTRTGTLLTTLPSTSVVTSSVVIPLTQSVEIPAATTTASHGQISATNLTRMQAAGVSVGTIGAVLVIGALIFCCVCVRKRKKKEKKSAKRKHSYDFIDKSPPRSPDEAPSPTVLERRIERVPPKRPSRPASALERVRKSVAKTDTRPDSPESVSSQRTTSQLLPEKPPQSPHVVTQLARSFSTSTKVTEFEDLTPGLAKPIHFPRPPLPVYGQYNRQMKPTFADSASRSPEQTKVPQLQLEIPNSRRKSIQRPNPPKLQLTTTSGGLKSTVNDHEEPISNPPSTARISMPLNSALTYLPSYYSSADSRTPVVPVHSSRMTQQPKRPCMPLMPVRAYRRPSRTSHASETSFESVDPDEPTPPDELEDDRSLGIQKRSPISGIRYPKIPRSANQAVPRLSPAQVSKSKFERPALQRSVDTLLGKRRGPSAAQHMERGIRLSKTESTCSQASSCSQVSSVVPRRTNKYDPAVQRGKFVLIKPPARMQFPPSSNRIGPGWGSTGSPEMSLKSPLWEPKLTPTRKGDALYISVGPQ